MDPIITMLQLHSVSQTCICSTAHCTRAKMSSLTESEEAKDTNELKEEKKPKEPEEDPLPAYQYEALKNPDTLRLLRLKPARDAQLDIDCEIVEIELPKNGEIFGHENKDEEEEKKNKAKKDSSGGTNELGNPVEKKNLIEFLETHESDDEETPPHGENEDEKEDAPPFKDLKNSQTQKKKESYEAVSWCWGKEAADQVLRVHQGDEVVAFHISKNLESALRALRKHNEVRQLWIDAICINQKDTKERNQQVPRMDKIYGGAANVCIWLGESSDDSKLAMDFIRERVLELWKFDELIENRKLAKHWAALIRLMKRPWFSRRWVVQEIALSTHGGTIYCGKDHNSWQDFADAVSLFVEVESATHRLSDVMKLDQSFGNIPDFFGDVSSLGAALLVDATSNLFRNAMTGERMPLSSLEYLVSRLSVFEATQPRDTIYALLAISKETTPTNVDPDTDKPELTQEQKAALKLAPKGGFANKPYNVNYRLPVIDVYKEFIEFSLLKSDKKRALDILCRSWAPTVMKSHDDPSFLNPTSEKDEKMEKGKGKGKWKKTHKTEEHKKVEAKKKEEEKDKDQEIPLPSWIPGLSGAAFEMEEHPTAGLRMERQNADPLVGLPDESGHRNYTAAGDMELDIDKLEFRKWNTLKKPNSSYPEFSMFVRGFILDEVSTVEQLAANGNIPYRWLQAGGWVDTDKNPPEEFWRTLVADRAQNGHNPPTYFPRACKESVRFKAKTMSKTGGYLDCRKLIHEGRCTIVAQFLRRVQEVIWNRQLMRTEGGRLGLVRDDVSPGFKVCILYGCSVPVILEEIKKTSAELKAELIDRYNQWYSKVKMVVAFCEVRYLLVKAKREQEKSRELRDKQVTAEPQPRRPGKGTWPLDHGELVEAKKLSAPLERRKPSLKVILEGSSGANGSEPGKATAPQMGDSASPRKIPPPPPPKKIHPPSPTVAEASDSEHSIENEAESPNEHQAPDSPSPDQKSGAKKEDASTPEGTEQPKTRKPKTEKEIQDDIERGKKLFDDRKRKVREGVAQEVLKYLCYYRLVGECYVHGMMNGEAIKRQNEEHLPQQVFELR
jgi:hypothetical protein